MQINPTHNWKDAVKEYIDSLPEGMGSGYSKSDPHFDFLKSPEGAECVTLGEWVTIKLYISHESD